MNATLSDEHQQWYIRRGEVVRGPFPKEKITNYLLRGRIKKGDELSPDQKAWQPASEFPQLLPASLFGGGEDEDAQLRQQLMAKKHWEAHRAVLNHESCYQQGDQDSYDDSAERDALAVPHSMDQANAGVTRVRQAKSANRTLVGAILVSILGAAMAMIYFNQPEPEVNEIDCAAAAAPNVNWSNCQMEAASLPGANLIGATMQNMSLMRADLSGSQLVGVNLSFSNLSVTSLRGADLRSATLVGASLKGADLSNATLDGADLSYVDFGGASLSGASITGAKFDKAKWIDGRICAVGSIGSCQ